MMEPMEPMGCDGTKNETIFISLSQLVKETGLPKNQILKDIHSGRLPAFRRGKSFYVYTKDSSRYIYELVCEAKGIDPKKYDSLLNMEEELLKELIINLKGGSNGHK